MLLQREFNHLHAKANLTYHSRMFSEYYRQTHLRIRFALFAGLLAILVQGIQFLGFYHGIAHAGITSQVNRSDFFEAAEKSIPSQPEHSGQACKLFDALLLGSCVGSPSFELMLQSQTHFGLFLLPQIWADKLLILWPYQSQAPPRLVIR